MKFRTPPPGEVPEERGSRGKIRTVGPADFTSPPTNHTSLPLSPGDIAIRVVGLAGPGPTDTFPWAKARRAAEFPAQDLPRGQRHRNAVTTALLLEALEDSSPDDDRDRLALLSALANWWAPADLEQRRQRHQQVDRVMSHTGAARLSFEVVALGADVAVRSRFEPVRTAEAA